MLDHVEEQLAHRLVEQDLGLGLQRLDAGVRLDPDGQPVLLLHPAAEPLQARHEAVLVEHRRAQLVAQPARDLARLAEQALDPAEVVGERPRLAAAAHRLDPQAGPDQQLLQVVVEDPGDPAPLAFLRLRQFGREGAQPRGAVGDAQFQLGPRALQRLLRLFARGDVLHRHQRHGRAPHVEAHGREQEGAGPRSLPGAGHHPHLDLVAGRARSRRWPGPSCGTRSARRRDRTAAARIFVDMRAAEGLAGPPAQEVADADPGGLRRLPVRLLDPVLAVHEQHDERRVVVDGREFLLAFPDGIALRPERLLGRGVRGAQAQRGDPAADVVGELAQQGLLLGRERIGLGE